METQLIVEAFAVVSWALVGVIFYDLRGQLRDNTKATQTLYSDIRVLIHRIEISEKESLAIVAEMKLHSERIISLREKIHDVVGELSALWGLARAKGWNELPEVPLIRRSKI